MNPKKIADEKVPAVKTVDYLQKLMTEIETQECQVDLREKLKNNLNLFSSSTLIESMDEPSTSGLNDVKRDEQLTDLAQNRKRSANKRFVYFLVLNFIYLIVNFSFKTCKRCTMFILKCLKIKHLKKVNSLLHNFK